MAKLGCQIRGTSKIVKKSFGGVAAITDAIGAAVPASTLTSGIKTSAQSQAEKKELEKQEKAEKMSKGGMPSRNKKNFRSTKAGAGMTQAGVKAYRRMNPGSKLSTAVTEDKPGTKRAARRKSYCARSAGQMKMFPKAAKDPNSRLRQARRRWKC
jgi:hypothetical protein